MSNSDDKFLRKQLLRIVLLLVGAVLFGTAGYVLIEEWRPLDALYMTIITMATVGYREIEPLSPTGQIFTILLIVGGVGIIAYASTTMVRLLVSTDIQRGWHNRRRRKMLEQLQNHDIVCGYGRVGQHIVAELHRQNKAFIIIDKNENVVKQCRDDGYLVIQGNASDENILYEAGIRRARSLFSVVDSDATNVFIILTARALCPELIIVARVNYDDAEPKLRRAGADRVISPYVIGGRRMVNYVDRPGVVDFLDVAMHSPGLELQIEEFVVDENSLLAGKSLGEARLRSEVGVNVLTIRCPGKPVSLHPAADDKLEVGARLIILGTRDQLNALSRFATPITPYHSQHRSSRD